VGPKAKSNEKKEPKEIIRKRVRLSILGDIRIPPEIEAIAIRGITAAQRGKLK
jgi:hypothetical protein